MFHHRLLSSFEHRYDNGRLTVALRSFSGCFAMPTLTDLHRSVEATLASKRLGQPVFLRYLWQTTVGDAQALDRLAHLAGVVESWFKQKLVGVFVVGSASAGQVSATLQFQEGASALLAVAKGKFRGGGVDLMLLGQRGAVYHDAGMDELWDEQLSLPLQPVDVGVRKALAESLRTGQPVPIGERGGP